MEFILKILPGLVRAVPGIASALVLGATKFFHNTLEKRQVLRVQLQS